MTLNSPRWGSTFRVIGRVAPALYAAFGNAAQGLERSPKSRSRYEQQSRKTPMTPPNPLVLNCKQSEWDIATREDFVKLLKATSSHPSVILDLTPVIFMDGSCLREILMMQAERAKRGFPPAHLVVVSPHVRRVFKIVQFDKFWPLYDNLEAALAAA